MKIVIFLAFLCVFGMIASGASMEIGGGIEYNVGYFYPIGSVGLLFPFTDSIDLTVQFAPFLTEWYVLCAIGGRYSFGENEIGPVPFVGADAGAILDLEETRILTVLGVNAGLNFVFGTIGAYLKASYRIMTDFGTPLMEITAGLNLGF